MGSAADKVESGQITCSALNDEPCRRSPIRIASMMLYSLSMTSTCGAARRLTWQLRFSGRRSCHQFPST
jgi:hypothetical protein